MNCKDCNAWCCKGFWVIMTPKKEMHKYYELHGYKPDKDGNIKIKIKARCKWLTKDNRCKHYNLRPDFCNTWVCDEYEAD